MRIIVLTKMFNEIDFLEIFVRHYLEQEVDEIILIDHGSTDGSSCLAATLPFCRLLSMPDLTNRYSYEIDVKMCNFLLNYARNHTDDRTWWLFPDIDELISTGPEFNKTLRAYLKSQLKVDGIGCVGLHCLPQGEKDDYVEKLSPKEIFSKLHALFPPRGFENPPRHGEAWKNIIWQINDTNLDRFQRLSFSVGNHVLIGNLTLKMHQSCLVAYHYKIRSIRRYISRTEELLARIPVNSSYIKVISEKLNVVLDWQKHNYRILRLRPKLTSKEITIALAQTKGQGEYLETPYPLHNG